MLGGLIILRSTKGHEVCWVQKASGVFCCVCVDTLRGYTEVCVYVFMVLLQLQVLNGCKLTPVTHLLKRFLKVKYKSLGIGARTLQEQQSSCVLQ